MEEIEEYKRKQALHSTMVLLKLRFALRGNAHDRPLHSTMVLLKQRHHGHILFLHITLHSTMVLLKPVLLYLLFYYKSYFTFHYGLIKTLLI